MANKVYLGRPKLSVFVIDQTVKMHEYWLHFIVKLLSG